MKTPTKTISLRVTEHEYNALVAYVENQKAMTKTKVTLTTVFRAMCESQLKTIVANFGANNAVQ